MTELKLIKPKQDEKLQKCIIRTASKTVKADISKTQSSRGAAHEVLNQYADEIIEALNLIIPEPFFIEMAHSKPKSDQGQFLPEHSVEVRIAIRMNPIHEWIYFMLMKVPFLRNFVSGPMICSYLIPSLKRVRSRNV